MASKAEALRRKSVLDRHGGKSDYDTILVEPFSSRLHPIAPDPSNLLGRPTWFYNDAVISGRPPEDLVRMMMGAGRPVFNLTKDKKE